MACNSTSNTSPPMNRYGVSGCNRFTGLRSVLADPVPGDWRVNYEWVKKIVEKVTPQGKEVCWIEDHLV